MIALRPATAGDRAFVETTYFRTQQWLLEALFGQRGEDVERAKFAQFYRPDDTSVIVVDGTEAGWMTVRRSNEEIELEGIYLLPEFQQRGIGTQLICELIAQARAASKPLRLSTAKINPARTLYRRLGFAETHEDEFKVFMEWRA